jgi:hypothetical protein
MGSITFVLLTALAVSANYLADLKQKYGGSISETLKVRPGIGVTIRSAQDGRVIEMLVVPLDPDSLVASRRLTIKKEDARSVVDELVPESSRGKYIIGTFLNVTCLPEDDCAGVSEDYESVHIRYNSARENRKVRYVDVQFKK